jgi:hypothetical protein
VSWAAAVPRCGLSLARPREKNERERARVPWKDSAGAAR